MKSSVFNAVTVMATICLGGLQGIAQDSTKTKQPDEPKPLISVEMTVSDNGHVIIPLYQGDEGPFRFLIDTGSDRIVLDESLKERLKLKIMGNASMRGAGSGSQSIEIAAPIELGIKDSKLAFSHMQPVIIPLRNSLGATGELPFDGIIGLPMFEHCVVQFDWANNIVNFFDELPTVEASTIELPLAIEQGYPFVEGSFVPVVSGTAKDAIEGKFMIDIGSFHGVLIDWPIVEQNKLLDSEDKEQFDVEAGSGIGGKIKPFRSTPTKLLQLGESTFEDLRVVMRTEEGGRPAVEGRIGHLGLGFLRDFISTFDYGGGKLLLAPSKDE